MGIMLALPGQWKKCRTRLWMWSELLQSSSMCFKDSMPSSVHRMAVNAPPSAEPIFALLADVLLLQF